MLRMRRWRMPLTDLLAFIVDDSALIARSTMHEFRVALVSLKYNQDSFEMAHKVAAQIYLPTNMITKLFVALKFFLYAFILYKCLHSAYFELKNFFKNKKLQ